MDDVVCCFCGLSLKAEAAVSLVAFPPKSADESQNFWAHGTCFIKKLQPSVPVHPDFGKTDVETISAQVRANFPELIVNQLQVNYPADDDGIWFFHIPADPADDIQIESSSGLCPFLIETNRDDSRRIGETVQDVVRIIIEHFNSGIREKTTKSITKPEKSLTKGKKFETKRKKSFRKAGKF
jgi:hypothetical protein